MNSPQEELGDDDLQPMNAVLDLETLQADLLLELLGDSDLFGKPGPRMEGHR